MAAPVIGTLRDRVVSAVQSLARRRLGPVDLDPQTAQTIRAVRGLTMASPERIFAACDAIRYVVRCDIPGAIVECGVWRGGMVLAMLRTLLECGESSRDVYLYDTFSGMSPPSARDITLRGIAAATLLRDGDRDDPNSVWCRASLADVSANVARAGYDPGKLHFIEGDVERTLPATIPERIALLRLDTDWYASTKHELEHLYPRLESGGVLIVDDYGHWKGAREAVDGYIAEHRLRLLLGRTDYTGRIAVKP